MKKTFLSILLVTSVGLEAKVTCSEINSYKEACMFLNYGYTNLDTNHNNIPCEPKFHKPCTTFHSKIKKYKKKHSRKHYVKTTNNKRFKNVCSEVLTASILEYHNLKKEQDLDTGVIYKYPKMVYVIPGVKNYNYYKKHCVKERFSDNHKKLLSKMIKLVE